jgi:hypothetical protein
MHWRIEIDEVYVSTDDENYKQQHWLMEQKLLIATIHLFGDMDLSSRLS